MALPEILTDDLNELAAMWLAVKEAERQATEDRRRIEDRIKSLAGVSENMEGTKTVEPDRFVIKIVGRIDRKVDSEKLQELAAEYGLTVYLFSLFRWKLEINMSAWKAADPSITKPLSAAITAKPCRPSFTIIPKE